MDIHSCPTYLNFFVQTFFWEKVWLRYTLLTYNLDFYDQGHKKNLFVQWFHTNWWHLLHDRVLLIETNKAKGPIESQTTVTISKDWEEFIIVEYLSEPKIWSPPWFIFHKTNFLPIVKSLNKYLQSSRSLLWDIVHFKDSSDIKSTIAPT